MNLDKLTIEIRPRSAWEAVDLGVLMARRWWWSLTAAWLLVSAPVWLVLCLLPPHLVSLQIMIVWWLKPLFERPLLHILSQAVFDSKPGTLETLRAFPRLAGMQVISSLLWRRLSTTRSMDLPVVQLEGLKGSRRSERLRVLHREDSSPATWITILGMHMEMFIVIAVYVLVIMFWPDVLDIDWSEYFIEQKHHWFTLLQSFITYMAMTLVAPFYVAGGFALYLNRRIRLEAWDLEIAFKRIVQKRQSPRRTATITMSFLLAVFLCAANPPEALSQDDARAQDSDTPAQAVEKLLSDEDELNRENSRELIEKIKEDDAFHEKKTIRVPDLSWLEFNEQEDRSEHDFGFLAAFFSMFAQFGEVLLWVIAILLIFFVVYRYRDWLAEVVFDKPPKAKRQKPQTLFGLDLSAESLPENIGDSARRLWQQGRHRDCMSLLYRASLSKLIDRGLDIRDGDTEQECLESTKKLGRQLSIGDNCIEYFGLLTRLWRQLAYGHILPREDDALKLCHSWHAVWTPEHENDHADR